MPVHDFVQTIKHNYHPADVSQEDLTEALSKMERAANTMAGSDSKISIAEFNKGADDLGVAFAEIWDTHAAVPANVPEGAAHYLSPDEMTAGLQNIVDCFTNT